MFTKLDMANKIIFGTFSFNPYNYIGQVLDSVVITDGRFDLKFDAGICYRLKIILCMKIKILLLAFIGCQFSFAQSCFKKQGGHF